MKRTRPSKLEHAMKKALVASERSHDEETQVGAVLVEKDSMAVLADGCNGFVRGAPDEILPSTRPDKYPYMIHAEQNLIANCAKHGVSTNNCIVVCNLSPCANCMRLLWQAGITKVVVKEKYRDFDQLLQMKDLSIEEKITPEGYYELIYRSSSGKPVSE